MDLKILAERFGMPADSTPQAVIDKAAGLADELKTMKQERDDAVALSERLTAKNEAMKKRDDAVKKQQTVLFVDQQITKGRIKPYERDEMISLHEKQPEVVEKMVEKRRVDDLLFRETGLSSFDDEPVSALAEVQSRAAELVSKESGISMAQAQVRVLGEDKALANRYRLETVSGAKDGDQ